MNTDVGTEMEELMKAALSATGQRRADALRVLKGEAALADASGAKPVTGPLLLGMGAAARFLGVSRSTLWRILQSGKIEKVELFEGSFRVRREDLVALAEGKFGFSGKQSRRGRPRKLACMDSEPGATP
jgi:excisionase family DNA binding protein